MQRVRYNGSYSKLCGETGIAKDGPHPEMLYVQFDNQELGPMFTHNWVAINKVYLEVLGPTEYTKTDFPKLKKPAQPKEYAPDTIAPELMTKRLREW